MRVDIFDFDLPSALIAERPAVPRDSARLLEVAADLRDRIVRDLPALLRPGDLLVFNDTRVIPARLFGRRGAAGVEVTLHKCLAADRWRAFARPARKLKPGDAIVFDRGLSATVAEKGEGGEVELAFDRGGADLMAALTEVGRMPLPPYIKRAAGADERDCADYQTIFAAKDGAVAAPTAGLHFTPALLAALEAGGIARVAVTLHVGAGTFLPVKAEDTKDHVMHAELGVIDAAAAAAVAQTRAAGGRIVAVGTTSLRLLETAADESGRIRPFSGDTNLFITPGYRFKAVDLLLTNFHLPRSTLFMLVCAFAGLDRMKAAYEHAKAAGYRFYSYGDCCLLHPAARP
jgi:S-adenosylmethionine:tRNA ribosyltransferase-isomerase